MSASKNRRSGPPPNRARGFWTFTRPAPPLSTPRPSPFGDRPATIDPQRSTFKKKQEGFNKTAAELRKSTALLDEYTGKITAEFDVFADNVREAAARTLSSPNRGERRFFTPDKIEALAALVNSIKGMAAGDASPAAYKKLDELYKEYKEFAKPFPAQEAALQNVIDAAKSASEAWDAAKKGREGLQAVDKDRAEVERKLKVIQDALDAAKGAAGSLKAATEGAATGAMGAESALENLNQTDASGVLDDLWNLDSAAWDLWGDADGAGGALDDMAATSMGGLIGEIDTATSAMWDLEAAAWNCGPNDFAVTTRQGGPWVTLFYDSLNFFYFVRRGVTAG